MLEPCCRIGPKPRYCEWVLSRWCSWDAFMGGSLLKQPQQDSRPLIVRASAGAVQLAASRYVALNACSQLPRAINPIGPLLGHLGLEEFGAIMRRMVTRR